MMDTEYRTAGLNLSFDEVKKDGIEAVMRFWREFGGEFGRMYLEDTCSEKDFNPGKARMHEYPEPCECDRSFFRDVHLAGMRICNAGCVEDLRDEPEDGERRARFDRMYDEIMEHCDGTLLILCDEVKSCCCERFAREIAYGPGYIMRSQLFPVCEGEMGEFPDVLAI